MLFVRLFFFTAAHLPPAGLRKENGKMKIRYEFVNGEVTEIEVEDTMGEILLDLDRQAYNSDHRETRRHISLNGMEYEGEIFRSGEDPLEEILRRETASRLAEAMERLSPEQRELLKKVYFENIRIVEIARAAGVTEAAIRGRLKKIYARLKKFLN